MTDRKQYRSDIVRVDGESPYVAFYHPDEDRKHPLLIVDALEDRDAEQSERENAAIRLALPLIEAAHECEATSCDTGPLIDMLNSSLCSQGLNYTWDQGELCVIARPDDE